MTLELSERQREIMGVSLELIAEKGIQGLTIKNLAKKIGFSESAIYRHFENKIQILFAILDFFKENTESLFKSELNNTDDSVTKINHLLKRQFTILSASPPLVALIFSEELFRNEEVLAAKVSEIMNSTFDILTNIIKTGQEKDEIRSDIEASHLSVIVMGSLRLFVKQWHMSNYGFNLIEKGEEISNSIHLLLKK